MGREETPFVDLPAALVEEVIQQTAEISGILLDTFKRVKSDQEGFRKELLRRDLVLSVILPCLLLAELMGPMELRDF